MSVAEISPLLLMRGIHKRFPGVHALKGVDLELRSGECLALLGENGAGKSTLIKMLGGAHQPDEGEIRLQGESIQIQGPQGIGCSQGVSVRCFVKHIARTPADFPKM